MALAVFKTAVRSRKRLEIGSIPILSGEIGGCRRFIVPLPIFRRNTLGNKGEAPLSLQCTATIPQAAHVLVRRGATL